MVPSSIIVRLGQAQTPFTAMVCWIDFGTVSVSESSQKENHGNKPGRKRRRNSRFILFTGCSKLIEKFRLTGEFKISERQDTCGAPFQS